MIKAKASIKTKAFDNIIIDSMTPSMLVAPPTLKNTPFDESVIILAGHQKDASMGFIINHPIGLTIKDLMEEDEDQDLNFTEKPVFFGGPVGKNSGFILYEHEPCQPLAPGFVISDTISISPSRKMLNQAAIGKLPGRFEFFLGYSAWNKGQLDRELASGGWLHSHLCPEIFFDVPPEDRWRYSYKFLGVSPFAFVQVPGGAQA